MDQMILAVLAIGSLCWGLHAMPRKMMKARVHFAQGVSLHRSILHRRVWP